MYRNRFAAVALFLGLLVPSAAQAQQSDSEAVLAVMQTLFDGMRKGDSAMVRSVFHPKLTTMATATLKDGVGVAGFGNMEGFVKAVGTPHAEMWDERIYNPEVRIDGNLATIWVEYSFFVGTKFSHCGVDALQLVKEGPAWKIVAIADTRRKTGCRES